MTNEQSPTLAVPGRRPRRPALRFSPTAWAKLVYFRDRSDAEIGGLGIAAVDDLLTVVDVELVRQRATGVSAVSADRAVAEFFARQVTRIREGMSPEQITRVWVHTHPYDSPLPPDSRAWGCVAQRRCAAANKTPADWAGRPQFLRRLGRDESLLRGLADMAQRPQLRCVRRVHLQRHPHAAQRLYKGRAL